MNFFSEKPYVIRSHAFMSYQACSKFGAYPFTQRVTHFTLPFHPSKTSFLKPFSPIRRLGMGDSVCILVSHTIKPSTVALRASKKQYHRITETAYYQAGKIVVQTLLPDQPPVPLITLNTFGTTSSTSADTYIPIESTNNNQSCSFLESRLISLYGGKAASFLIEYQSALSTKLIENKLTAKSEQGKKAAPIYGSKIYCAGTGTNIFQSTIGNLEIQIATRLATIMINYWNFYSFSNTYPSNSFCNGTGNDTPLGAKCVDLPFCLLRQTNSFQLSTQFLSFCSEKVTLKKLSKEKGPNPSPYRGKQSKHELLVSQQRKNIAYPLTPLCRYTVTQKKIKERKVINGFKNEVFDTTVVLDKTNKISSTTALPNHLLKSFLENQISRQNFLEAKRKNPFLEFYLRSTLFSFLPGIFFCNQFLRKKKESTQWNVEQLEFLSTLSTFVQSFALQPFPLQGTQSDAKNPLSEYFTTRIPLEGDANSANLGLQSLNEMVRVNSFSQEKKDNKRLNVFSIVHSVGAKQNKYACSDKKTHLSSNRLINLDLSYKLKFDTLQKYFVKTKIFLSNEERSLTIFPFPIFKKTKDNNSLSINSVDNISTNSFKSKTSFLKPFANRRFASRVRSIFANDFDTSYPDGVLSFLLYNDFVTKRLAVWTINKSIFFPLREIPLLSSFDETYLCFAYPFVTPTTIFKNGANKRTSYSKLRTSVENIANRNENFSKLYSQVNTFQLINSLQFSNLQRNRFYPGWFRLYLPDIEATQYLKNVTNYYFSLGLQTLTRPSLNELKHRFSYCTWLSTHFLCKPEVCNPRGTKLIKNDSNFLNTESKVTKDIYPSDETNLFYPAGFFYGISNQVNLTNIKMLISAALLPDLQLTQSLIISDLLSPNFLPYTVLCEGDTSIVIGSKSSIWKDIDGLPGSLVINQIDGVDTVVKDGNKYILPGKEKGLLPLTFRYSIDNTLAIQNTKKFPTVSYFVDIKSFFYNTNNNLSIGVGLLRNAAKQRNQLNQVEHRKKASPFQNEVLDFVKSSFKKVIDGKPGRQNVEVQISDVDGKIEKEPVRSNTLLSNVSPVPLIGDEISVKPRSIVQSSKTSFLNPLIISQNNNSIKLFGSPRLWAIDRIINIGLKQHQFRGFSLIQTCIKPATTNYSINSFTKKSLYASYPFNPFPFPLQGTGDKVLTDNSGAKISLATNQLIADKTKESIVDANLVNQFEQFTKSRPILSEKKKVKQLDISLSLLLEKNIFPINYTSSPIIQKQFLYHSLVNNCFAKAGELVNQNRQLLDFFADYLLRYQIVRQHQILYLFSALLLDCQ